MSPIHFQTKISRIGSTTILQLPKDASEQLPSRGMVMIKGTMNGHDILTALEPDGKGSHWFKLDDAMIKMIGAKVGDTVTLEIEPVKKWPEPEVPADLKSAIEANPIAQESWVDITPMARWDWIRWIRGTKNPETRKKRIDVTLSKFAAGKRRPCCFNRSECTDPSVSNGGVLFDV